MNLKNQLLLEHSKKNSLLIVEYLESKPSEINALMDCFFSNEYRITQRSAMVVSALFDRQPGLMEPYKIKIIENLNNKKLHDAVKRNSVRILQFVQIPEAQQSLLFDSCLRYLTDVKEAIAIKAFSMTILYNCCKRYPELKVEVILLLEDVLLRDKSKGIQSRGRKVLKQLIKL